MTVLDTWRVLGMRGTGSHDIELKDVFVPDAATQEVRRPAGKWHPSMHVVALIALPVVYAAYLGTAEAARELALDAAERRRTIRARRSWSASWRASSPSRGSFTRT